MKFTNPKSSWAAIAADCGYFDQMHMIRDFKRYSNQSPGAFFTNDDKFERPSVYVSDPVTFEQVGDKHG